jgi:uncharacterized protein YjbI with pentapeptide repeats
MANEDHLARLREGVDAWNQWREANRDIQPDLGGAQLGGADLAKVDLSNTDLSWANLFGAYQDLQH